jgi:hypothetical protein
MKQYIYLFIFCLASVKPANAADLEVGKICPVTYQKEPIGLLVFSREWYHSGRSDASYIPRDNATGVGLEIHLINNVSGHLEGQNIAHCDRYRIIQIRKTNTRLFTGEKPLQIDVPDHFLDPFYDSAPLEHGYGVHQTPADDDDKPWRGRPVRASTVAIYDTPYVSDSYGIEGEDINVQFETCSVCERDRQYDNVLSCGNWGYKREYMGGMTGWAEPEFTGVQCKTEPSEQFKNTLNNSNRIEYSYWINWR